MQIVESLQPIVITTHSVSSISGASRCTNMSLKQAQMDVVKHANIRAIQSVYNCLCVVLFMSYSTYGYSSFALWTVGSRLSNTALCGVRGTCMYKAHFKSAVTISTHLNTYPLFTQALKHIPSVHTNTYALFTHKHTYTLFTHKHIPSVHTSTHTHTLCSHTHTLCSHTSTQTHTLLFTLKHIPSVHTSTKLILMQPHQQQTSSMNKEPIVLLCATPKDV